MPMHMVCMYSLLWQMVYTDAHAYTVHVVLCLFLDVAVFVYVLTYIFFTRYDFKSVYFVLMHFRLKAILILPPAW